MDEEIKVRLPYSAVESSFLDLFDLAENPENYLIIKLDNRVICDKCHQSWTIRKDRRYISFRCGCGCRLLYPKNNKGVMISTFVDKETYEKERGLNGRKPASTK